jgi:hypothetical protein
MQLFLAIMNSLPKQADQAKNQTAAKPGKDRHKEFK